MSRTRAFIRTGTLMGLAVIAGTTFSLVTQPGMSAHDFWANLYFDGVMAENFETLADMAKSSDVVVTGRITALEKSRSWVAAPELGDDGVAFYAKATVRVDEVLAGSFVAGEGGALGVEIFLINWPKLSEMAASLPPERVMLFLRRQSDTDTPLYRVVNVEQGYLRDLEHVEPPIGATEPWVVALHGRAFADVVSDVKAAVAPTE